MGLGINIGYKAGACFVFGVVFALVGLAMTFGSNILYTTLTNQKQNPVELISKAILHTPMTTALLFLGIFISLIKSPVFIAVYYVIIAYLQCKTVISSVIDSFFGSWF